MGCKHYQTVDSPKREPQVGRGLFCSTNSSLQNFNLQIYQIFNISHFKEVVTSAHWSFLVQVDQWGWDSAETLLPITQQDEGDWEGSRDGEAFYSNILFLHSFHCYINMLKCFYNLYQ